MPNNDRREEIGAKFAPFAKRTDSYLKKKGIVLSSDTGILLGLSGGADSVFLLFTLLTLSDRYIFPLHVLHVEHGIRGEESKKDAAFCRELCDSLDVPFRSVSVSVPAYAAEHHLGIEEAARELRYRAFGEYAEENPKIRYIATAHNRDDRAETVLFRLLRGCGGTGASGIPFRNGNIIRPILGFSSREIRSFLRENGFPFVYDSTNGDTEYARNYIRREIMPRLERISSDPAKSLSLSADHIREDAEYLDSLAEKEKVTAWGRRTRLATLPDPILKRVVVSAFFEISPEMPESVHIDAALAQIRKGKDGQVSFPGGKTLRVVGDSVAFVSEDGEDGESSVRIPLPTDGGERFVPFSGDTFTVLVGVTASENLSPEDRDFLFVHKNAKKAILSSATIKGGLFVRAPEPGDRIRYAGMTHEVRKILTAKKIPRELRGRIPLLCDDGGILWIPGVAVREGCDGRREPIEKRTEVLAAGGLTGLISPKNESHG